MLCILCVYNVYICPVLKILYIERTLFVSLLNVIQDTVKLHRNGTPNPTLERHGHDLGWCGRSKLDYEPQKGNKIAVNVFHLRKGNVW
jgi:hypothetical protein